MQMELCVENLIEWPKNHKTDQIQVTSTVVKYKYVNTSVFAELLTIRLEHVY